MDTVQQMAVIQTTLTRRGKGCVGDPVRIVTQYWTPGGELLAEVDPCIELEWARKVSAALIDAPEGDTSDGRDPKFYEGWYAARDAAYIALTGERYGA